MKKIKQSLAILLLLCSAIVGCNKEICNNNIIGLYVNYKSNQYDSIIINYTENSIYRKFFINDLIIKNDTANYKFSCNFYIMNGINYYYELKNNSLFIRYYDNYGGGTFELNKLD